VSVVEVGQEVGRLRRQTGAGLQVLVQRPRLLLDVLLEQAWQHHGSGSGIDESQQRRYLASERRRGCDDRGSEFETQVSGAQLGHDASSGVASASTSAESTGMLRSTPANCVR
jgi:hypothetical protein